MSIIDDLKKMRQEVLLAEPANAAEAVKKRKLLADLDARTAFCNLEQNLSNQFQKKRGERQTIDQQMAMDNQVLQDHEQLKKSLVQQYGKHPLTQKDLSPGDLKRYIESRQRRDKEKQQLDSLEKTHRDLVASINSLRDQYSDLRNNTALGKRFSQDPVIRICVPCMTADAGTEVKQFLKENRQAAGKEIWPGQQHYENCGIQSAAQIIEQATGRELDEDILLKESIESGNAENAKPPWWKLWASDDSGRTTAKDRKKILRSLGVDSKIILTTTKDALAAAITQKKGIIVSVNAGVLWHSSRMEDLNSGHAITVYDGEFDQYGNLTHVYINDTGTGKQGQKIEINEFMEAVKETPDGSEMNVTKNAIY